MEEHESKIARSETTAIQAVLRKFPGYKVASTKKIVSFDNVVYLFWLDEENSTSPSHSQHQKKAVVRFPKKNPATRPKQHNPSRQAWVCRQWRELGVPVPETLEVDEDYLVEGFVDGGSLVSEAIADVFPTLGKVLHNMHSVKTRGFGGFGEESGVGRYETWDAWFRDFFLTRLKVLKEQNVLDEDLISRLERLYEHHRPYLLEFKESRLLHGDLCSDNVMVARDGVDNRYKLSGIVDFCDVISGDPLYDFAEILGISAGWAGMESLLANYGRELTPADMNIVHLYGAFLCVFFMVDEENWTVRHGHVPEYAEKLRAVLKLSDSILG